MLCMVFPILHETGFDTFDPSITIIVHADRVLHFDLLGHDISELYLVLCFAFFVHSAYVQYPTARHAVKYITYMKQRPSE